MSHFPSMLLFFFNDTATTEIYTLSLHDALPIFTIRLPASTGRLCVQRTTTNVHTSRPLDHHYFVPYKPQRDRKSTRLNSSHANISYAVFCLKKKKRKYNEHRTPKTRLQYCVPYA